MGRVHIRPALPSELPAIGDLRVAAYQADGFLAPPSTYADALRALGTDDDGDVLAAVDDGAVVGTVMLQPWPHAGEIARGPDEAEIRALAVAPQARGRGAGKALLAATVELAAGRGVRHLVLLTLPGMRSAQHLYQAAGFRRLPGRDRSPHPGLILLAYGLLLGPGPGRAAG